MNDPAIITENMTQKYGKTKAVDGLRLEVGQGEIFGMVGPDGASKTTTIQMLCGLSKPLSGWARVAGIDVAREADRLGGKIGYMSESFSLYGTLSVGENIDFYADLYQVPLALRRERKAQLLQFSRLAGFIDRPAEQLSGGMKKKLALCCSLIYAPEILFLDATTGVDPVSRRDLWKIIYNFLSEGVTVFVSTPYMDEAERCDRVALIHQGRILHCGTPRELKQNLTGDLLAITGGNPRQAAALLHAHLACLDARGCLTKCSFYPAVSGVMIERAGLAEARAALPRPTLVQLKCRCSQLEECRGGCRYRASLYGDPWGQIPGLATVSGWPNIRCKHPFIGKATKFPLCRVQSNSGEVSGNVDPESQ